MVRLQHHLLTIIDRVEVATVGEDYRGILRSLGVIVDHQVVERLRLRVLTRDVYGVAGDVLCKAPLRYRQLGRLILDREVVLPEAYLTGDHPVVLKPIEPSRQQYGEAEERPHNPCEGDARSLH